MKEQVEKTRQFLCKQRLTLDKNLKDSEPSGRLSRYFENSANCLLRTAKKMEDAIYDEHDPRFERVHMLIEELGETILGLSHCDEIETFDGLSDLAYVVIGTALAFDLPIVEGLDEICDSNLTKKPRTDDDPRCRNKGPDYRPPNLKKVLSLYRGIDVQAERTGCGVGDATTMTTVHVKRRYHDELTSWWIYVSEGGVTGYESMEESHVQARTDVGGWCANMGTKNTWDKLFLPAESMKTIQEWLEQ